MLHCENTFQYELDNLGQTELRSVSVMSASGEDTPYARSKLGPAEGANDAGLQVRRGPRGAHSPKAAAAAAHGKAAAAAGARRRRGLQVTGSKHAIDEATCGPGSRGVPVPAARRCFK